jgi:transglutaminase-like putative cysteine protease
MASTSLQSLQRRLHQLPRDTRDTLFTLAVIGWVLLPQLGNLPLWCSTMAGGVLLWRTWLTVTGRPLPGLWWRMVLLAVTVTATLLTYRTLLGREPGVTLIVVLLTLKTLELRARRDAFVVFFLCFFTMLTNFFFSQSLFTAAAMLVALLGLLTALVNAHMPVGKPTLRQSAQIAGGMVLLGAPIMAVLFVLFPRIGPLWGVPSDTLGSRSGLSATMQVGSMARIALDNGIAMRVRFDGPAPAQSSLYFRGPVLSTFDGREWLPLRPEFPAAMQPAAELRLRGAPLRYEVTLEPGNGGPWLMLLDASANGPLVPQLRSRMTSELQWVANRTVNELLRYRAESYTDFQHGPVQASPGLQEYVTLPAGYNPRTLGLAAELLRQPALRQADGAARVAAVMARLRSGGYTYTLSPGVSGEHSADEFWFDSKQGFCEHIASSFVILMRALDVPARVVTGYQGGELNPVDGYWVVRHRDAHAWAEVWLAGRGWVRVDPTTAVAPSRVETPQRLDIPEGAIANAVNAVSPGLRVNLRSLWEASNNRWNQWVLNYTQDRQLSLLRALGFDAPTWQTLSYLLIATGVLASLVGLAWAAWDSRRQDPWLRLLRRASTRLQGLGVQFDPQTPPRQLARLTLQQLGAQPAFAQAMHDWLLRLEAQRYAPPAAQPLKLQTLARELQRLPRPT